MKKIGIAMLNMGGPRTAGAVKPFLRNLFGDPDLMQTNSPLVTKLLSGLIAGGRHRRIQAQYEAIGGGSPIQHWTDVQGRGMTRLLNRRFPHRHFKHYVSFRYVKPNAFTAVEAMLKDGVEIGVAFSQYPQYSCTTTGSSLTQLWEAVNQLDRESRVKWCVIDRWNTSPKFVNTVTKLIRQKLKLFSRQDDVVLLFSAHSLPIRTVNRGDRYVQEVHETVAAVMGALRRSGSGSDAAAPRHVVAWQSRVGPVTWQGPQTESVLRGLGRQGARRVLLVPIAFTSDHIETLYEIDREYAEVAELAGVAEFCRTESLNGDRDFVEALADIVQEALEGRVPHSREYPSRCAECWQKDVCRRVVNPVFKQ